MGAGMQPFAEPPGADAIIDSLGAPVYGFIPQSHVAEVAATSQKVRGRVFSVSLSYSYFRHPLRREHPDNFVTLTPEQERAIRQAEASNLPPWLVDQITRIRYPTLWEAVRTTKAIPGDPLNALASRLATHVNGVLRSGSPDHARVRAPSASVAGRLNDGDLLENVSVVIDGEARRGRRLRVGSDLEAVGVHIENHYVTIVVDRNVAPHLQSELISLRPTQAGAAEPRARDRRSTG